MSATKMDTPKEKKNTVYPALILMSSVTLKHFPWHKISLLLKKGQVDPVCDPLIFFSFAERATT